MTGFVNEINQTANSVVDISIKSYNNRFLDLRVNLPKEYLNLESKIREVLKQSLSRGSVYLYFNKMNFTKKTDVKLDLNLARKISNTYKNLFSKLDIDVNLNSNLFDQAVKFESVIDKKEDLLILNTVKKAIHKLILQRKREGNSIKKEVSGLLKNLSQIVLRIDRTKDKKPNLRNKLAEIKEVLTDLDINRLAYEIVNNLGKLEISEEVSRLKEHIKAFNQDMRVSGPIGKKLDFYTQELLREVNTISSKSNTYKVNKLAVEAKLLIEQIKEQVQNIE